uniref:Uncharacterized protein n=1 Tax=Aegilops tauschii TaxID=37682 RepID=M8BZH3_AEGTA
MCMDRSPVPAKKIWLAIASRLGLRPTAGLRNLRKEVRTCEYRDVHIMWEMLREMDSPMPLEEKQAAAAAAGARGGRRRQEEEEGVEPLRLLLLRVLSSTGRDRSMNTETGQLAGTAPSE